MLFVLLGYDTSSSQKVKNHTKIHRCQVQSSFGEAEKRPDDEKAAGNTLCIGKAFEDVWAFFLPVKTVCVLVNRGYFIKNMRFLLQFRHAGVKIQFCVEK